MLLLLIGVANCALYYGDVMKDYTIVGLVVLGALASPRARP
jgi:hypothetical protein